MRVIIFLSFIFLFLINNNAQSDERKIVIPSEKYGLAEINNFENIPFDSVLYNKIMNESLHTKAMIIGINLKVNFSPINSGRIDYLPNGGFIWRIGICSKGANSLGLILENFKMNENDLLHVYNSDKSVVSNAFTQQNNSNSGVLPVQLINGDKIIIEFYSISKIQSSFFTIKEVIHDFRNKPSNLKTGFRASCENSIDINCKEGADLQTIKKSVCKMVIYKTSGSILCSGTLINNARFDGKPYIYTAYHCISSFFEAERTVFTFNYESPTCKGRNGIETNQINGSNLRAYDSYREFSLVELNYIPPVYFTPYYAGWTLDTAVTGPVVTIHHPQGDVKKISKDNDAPEITCYLTDNNTCDPQYQYNGFWKIEKWDLGVTEKGSSGSPLFNTNNQVIGSLTGGYSDCLNTGLSDYYSRFSVAWNDLKASNNQLKYWLDPDSTGVTELSGFDPYLGYSTSCDTFTNILTYEKSLLLPLTVGWGYYSGQNSDSIISYAEKFIITDTVNLSGVWLNVKKNTYNSNSTIKINVWTGSTYPENLIYEKSYNCSYITSGKSNYFSFYPMIAANSNLFIGYTLNYEKGDTFALAMANKRTNKNNSAFLLVNNQWKSFDEYTGWGTSLDIKVILNSWKFTKIKKITNYNLLKVYPNPTEDFLNVVLPQDSNSYVIIKICNVTGQIVFNSLFNTEYSEVKLDLSKLKKGLYIINAQTNKGIWNEKFSKKN